MRKIIGVAAAGLIAVAIGFWLNSATSQSVTESSATGISIWEIHNLAHVEFLPVQHFDDQSLVFAENPREK
jgi:hypothetical protein